VDWARFEPVVRFFHANRHVGHLREAGVEVHCWLAEVLLRLTGLASQRSP